MSTSISAAYLASVASYDFASLTDFSPSELTSPTTTAHTNTNSSHTDSSTDLEDGGLITRTKTVSATGESVLDHGPPWKKWVILFVLSWVSFSTVFSSTSLFTAAEEIGRDFDVSPAYVLATSGGLLAAMGVSPFIWSPMGALVGRRWAYNVAMGVLLATNISAIFVPSWKLFVVLRILSGFQGTSFHVTGQSILAERFHPVQRGTATGFFICATSMSAAVGPCIAAVIITYTDWRKILWLQSGMIGLGLIFSLTFLPPSRYDRGMIRNGAPLEAMVATFNPVPVFKLIAYPNILLTDLSCGLLSWSQFFLLAAPRLVISARFELDEPLMIGLFYLVFVVGFLLGTVGGGRWSDRVVGRWIVKRGGYRWPQDRLRSGICCFFFILPAAQLAYGWGLVCDSCSTDMWGLALPAATGFVVSASLLAAFAGLNTYCGEAIPKQRARIVQSKYLVQYLFGAAASASVDPLISAIGYGPACSLGAGFTIIAGIMTLITSRRGAKMQRWWEHKVLGLDSDVDSFVTAPDSPGRRSGDSSTPAM